MARILGGRQGQRLYVSMYPTAAFKLLIDALKTAKTDWVGVKLVTLTFLNNYEVENCADDTHPNGRIINAENDTTYGYILLVDLWTFVDQNSAIRPAVRIVDLNKTGGTCALQDTVQVNGSTYMYVEDAGTGGYGAVIAVNTNDVDVLM